MMDGQVEVIVRPSIDNDLDSLHRIYSHHVAHGTASWELDPPSRDEMKTRRAAILALGLPYLVCELAGDVVGFAYAGQFRPRAGYRYTVEDSIYIGEGFEGRGFGRRLLTALINACEAAGYRQMIAVIGDSSNQASIELHQKLGFEVSGRLTSSGFKFGRWLDTVFMQRALGNGDKTLPPLS